VLIKRADLERNREREISILVRRWLRPTVKNGRRLRTQIGVLDR
jgi:hypothetical protein